MFKWCKDIWTHCSNQLWIFPISTPNFPLLPAGISQYLCSTYSDKARIDLSWGFCVLGTPHHQQDRDYWLCFLLGCPPSHFLRKCHTSLLHAAFMPTLSTFRQGKAATRQQYSLLEEGLRKTWATRKSQNLPKVYSQIHTPAATTHY